jgi:hypothetical protein
LAYLNSEIPTYYKNLIDIFKKLIYSLHNDLD